MRTATRAITLPTGRGHDTFGTATGAKPMAQMPLKDGARDRGQFSLARGQPGHHGAQFGKAVISGQCGVALFAGVQKLVQGAVIQIVRLPARQIRGKQRRTAFKPQEHLIDSGIGHHGVIQRQQSQRPVLMHQRLAAPDQHRTCQRLRAQSGQRRRVTAQGPRTIKRRAAKCHRFCVSHAPQLPRRRKRRNRTQQQNLHSRPFTLRLNFRNPALHRRGTF